MSGLLLPGDALDIVDRVHQGDPTVGWRGDPSVDVYTDDQSQTAAAYGFDRSGHRYLMCVVNIGPGWQHEMLRRLRDGDWQNDDQYERIVRANRQVDEANDYAREQRIGEASEHAAFTLKRLLGSDIGGLSKWVY